MRAIAPLGTYIAVQMLTQISIAYGVPNSRLHQLVAEGGIPARVGTVVVSVLCIYVLIDIACSMVMDRRNRRLPLPRVARRQMPGPSLRRLSIKDFFGWLRLYAWLALGLGHAGLFLVAEMIRMPLLLALPFAWAAVWCGVIAVLDITGPRRFLLAKYRGT